MTRRAVTVCQLFARNMGVRCHRPARPTGQHFKFLSALRQSSSVLMQRGPAGLLPCRGASPDQYCPVPQGPDFPGTATMVSMRDIMSGVCLGTTASAPIFSSTCRRDEAEVLRGG